VICAWSKNPVVPSTVAAEYDPKATHVIVNEVVAPILTVTVCEPESEIHDTSVNVLACASLITIEWFVKSAVSNAEPAFSDPAS
jgi:hypothetical protein